jgi:sterol desaturase/sphingolipid hydroxylase (fatty acid hydroxylase superfamily)
LAGSNLNIDLDGGRLTVFVVGFSLCFVLERLFSARKATLPPLRRIFMHAGIGAFNTTLVRVISYVPLLAWIVHVEEMGWGVSRWLGLSGWTEFLLSIIVLDLFDYFWHRANHRLPFLWRFHKAHHMDNDMDVFTALRFHPGELLISSLAKGTWVVAWGPSAIAWFLFEALVSLCAQIHHTNVDLPDNLEKKLSLFIVTPRFHASHHLVEREFGNQNFSTIFSFWDPLFGSLSRKLSNDKIKNQALGLPQERDQTMSILQFLLEPLKHRNLSLANKHLK